MNDAPDFETMMHWMQPAADGCDLTGRPEAALLWRDAMHYLRSQQAEIERLRFALLSQECREAFKVGEARG
jgi:hypothetical protein